ncbi:MarR family winged helix-turn-helix transcriptional regulator [Paenibacillus tarimensis]|uniref:MarR family winged helix-turn-helix transcriptional regulator n=1 Tax=Paenibacillus tarimensis TaxID=416012 RepID=UPI001F3E6686|nr:MarR family transcriptional regulator [Paenibacillus tarimensis]MCF2943718.1 MarR family transcriptional regulator [Paenibacillus tarimensis]
MEFDIRQSTGHLMVHVMKLHRHTFHKLTEEYDIFPGQPPLLFRLHEKDGQSQKELAESMRVKPATLTVMINRMVKNGHVVRRPDPADQRVSRVYLTDRGRSVMDSVREALALLEEVSFRSFSAEDKQLFHRQLQQMVKDLSEFDAGKYAEGGSTTEME